MKKEMHCIMKKLLSILLSLVLLSSLCAAFAEEDVIDVSIVIYQRSNQGNADDIWWWDYCREQFGINFTVTQVTSASDYKSIAFASGDMPDVFYQMFMSSAQQVEFGETSGLLIDLAPYITPEIMPNLTRILDSNPTYRAMLTASNGAIYSLGSFNNANNSCMTFYINQKWLDEAGLEVPKTLDEFSEVMAAFKARGEDVVPMAGDLGDSPRFIMNAFGFITHAAASLTTIAMRNGEPTFVYGDREVFPEYLKVVHDYYEKGYFSPNLFADQVAGDETAALKANDLTGFSQNTSGVINPDDWTSCYFLTSDWNPTSQVYRSYSAVNNQSFSISATCDPAKVERLMKWLDWHFDYDNYILMHYGPSAEETDILYGLESGYTATLNEEGRYEWTCAEIENGTYNSFGDYQNLRVQGIIGGYLGLGYDMFEEATREYNPPVYNHDEEEHVLPYLVDGYPDLRFFDAETNERCNELATPINTYVEEQYALFVSGDLEINDENLENFFNTLDGLGYEEYLQIYSDYYYNTYLAQ